MRMYLWSCDIKWYDDVGCEVLWFVWKTNNNHDTWRIDDSKHMFYLMRFLWWIWMCWWF